MKSTYLPLTFSIILAFVNITVSQTSESSLKVIVFDQLNAVVVDAKVTLTNKKRKSEAITDKEGVAKFSNLEAGEYYCLVEANGFKVFQSSLIKVKTGQNVPITAKLEIEIQSELNVDDENLNSNDGRINVLTEEDIKKLPDNPELFSRILQNMAGSSITGGSMPIKVDGFEGEIPPKEIIKEIRFDRSIFSAKEAGAYGGGIEIFTKSSVKKFSYGFKFNYRDAKFDAGNPYIFTKPPFRNSHYTAYIIGPLIPQKASFIFDYKHTDTQANEAINATTLSSDFKFSPVRGFFQKPSYVDDLKVTVKADVTVKHNLYLNYNFFNSRSFGNGVGDFNLSSRSFKSENIRHIFRLGDTFFVNQNFINQSRLEIRHSKTLNYSQTQSPSIVVQEAFSSGGSQFSEENSNLTVNFYNDSIWTAGKYDIRFGGALRGQKISQNSESNFGGTYIFAGRQAPALDSNNNPLLDANGKIQLLEINSLEAYRRTILFSTFGYRASQIRELGGGASQLSISGGNPSISDSQIDSAFYIQSYLNLSKEALISLGLRYENQSNFNNNSDFSPRIGFEWRPKSDEKKNSLFSLPTVQIGFGLFYTRLGLTNFLSEKRTNLIDSFEYVVTNPEILNIFPFVPSVESLAQFKQPKIKREVDQNIRSPLEIFLAVSASKKLPKNLSLGFTFYNTQGYRQAVLRNVNAPLAGTYNPTDTTKSIFPLGREIGFLFSNASIGKKNSKSISVDLNYRKSILISKRLNLSVSYLTFSYGHWSENNDIVVGSGNPFDPYDFSREYSPSSNRHQITISHLGEIFGISFSNYLSVETGGRFNITTGIDSNGDGFYTERPAFATDLNKTGLIQTKYGILDPNPTNANNLIPRNLGRGFASFNLDTSFSKWFSFGGEKAKNSSRKYRIGFEIYIKNITNTNNKGIPVGNISSPSFLKSIGYNRGGSVTGTTSAGVFSGFSPRTINFSTSLNF